MAVFPFLVSWWSRSATFVARTGLPQMYIASQQFLDKTGLKFSTLGYREIRQRSGPA
jgi:hypothetical protein